MSVSLTKITSVFQSFLRVSPSPTVSAITNICSEVKPSAFVYFVTRRNYAADFGGGKKSKMASSGSKMKDFPVEKDPYKLVTHCCGLNYFQNGEEVKLKPDSEYPDWLYTLEIGRPKKLEQLDPNSLEYWTKIRKLARQRKNQLHRLRVKILKKF